MCYNFLQKMTEYIKVYLPQLFKMKGMVNLSYYEKLKEIRKTKNLNQAEVAQMLGILQQQYSEYERGFRQMPLNYLTDFCKLLEVSADYILSEEIKAKN